MMLKNDFVWRSIADELPEIDELILTYSPDEDRDDNFCYGLGTYDGMEREFDFTGKRYGDPKPTAQDGEYSWTFTHWMRVPRYHPDNGVTIKDNDGTYLDVEINPENKTCLWMKPDDYDSNTWAGECGIEFNLECDTPKENGMIYCPKCGKVIQNIDR